jgi:hypothetical protein
MDDVILALKPLSEEAIPGAMEKAEHYRLLNEPAEAESICNDILEVAPDHQDALITLILALTDQFDTAAAASVKSALALIPRLHNEYQQLYYTGIIYERQAKAKLAQHYPGAGYDMYDLLMTAMNWFEQAEEIQPPGNAEAILRWNTCTRLIWQHKLQRRPKDDFKPYLE